ncbi:hypothetical protein WL93_24050 [Burkholderia diffusa]|uniref:SDR family NAD(P)-dependent oxidoreductase n=1 Tax=Burkholderia diffusa TaxID=488732 RepID=UPI0007554051|nr:SDR family oxidoreductase [Burkholderia diffusa]KWF80447.1 hypothetical protein WL93_24050 [Burkholderia diffusa]
MNFYRNKVAVITGAGSGIGRALAVQLAQAGARLALSDINEASLQETAKACSGPHGEVRTYLLDVADSDAFQVYADQVISEFGQVDLVVNNAGVTLVSTVEHASIDELKWQLDINLMGVIYGTKAFLPFMLERRQGVIVNVSSVFGLMAFPAQAFYNVSKFGVRAFTECLWFELRGTGVRAVSVHPGGIRTNIEKGARTARQAGEFESELLAKFDRILRTPPEKVASDILRGVANGKRRILSGYLSRVSYWLPRLLPNHYDWFVRQLIKLS